MKGCFRGTLCRASLRPNVSLCMGQFIRGKQGAEEEEEYEELEGEVEMENNNIWN